MKDDIDKEHDTSSEQYASESTTAAHSDNVVEETSITYNDLSISTEYEDKLSDKQRLSNKKKPIDFSARDEFGATQNIDATRKFRFKSFINYSPKKQIKLQSSHKSSSEVSTHQYVYNVDSSSKAYEAPNFRQPHHRTYYDDTSGADEDSQNTVSKAGVVERAPLEYLKDIATKELQSLSTSTQQRSLARLNKSLKNATYNRNQDTAFNRIEIRKTPKDDERNKGVRLPTNKENIRSFADFADDMFDSRIAREGRIYKCPEPACKKELPSLSRIKRHYLVHTNVKPFKCPNPDCDKAFSRKDNMLQHYRIHCSFNDPNNI